MSHIGGATAGVSDTEDAVWADPDWVRTAAQNAAYASRRCIDMTADTELGRERFQSRFIAFLFFKLCLEPNFQLLHYWPAVGLMKSEALLSAHILLARQRIVRVNFTNFGFLQLTLRHIGAACVSGLAAATSDCA